MIATAKLPSPEVFEAMLAQKSLGDFVKQAWSLFDPKQLEWNRHHDIICEYLEAVALGEIRDLVITVPPRHTKSSIASICFTPWLWTTRSDVQFLYASHDGTLAIEHSVKARRIIESFWYQARWGSSCSLAEDQNQKTKFENLAGGHRTATSVGGSVTGKGGDICIVDDPHKVDEADSASLAGMKAAIDWYDGTFSTRRNNPQHSARIIIMQRIHQNDLCGHVQERGGYTHLDMQAKAEQRTIVRMPVSRTEHIIEEDDLLWPGRFGQVELDDARLDLGLWKFSAQFQQRPTPKAGGMLKREWWKFYSALPGDVEEYSQSWDTASKDKEMNDFSVCITATRNETGIYLVDLWRDKVLFPELKIAARGMFVKYNAMVVLIEDKSSGIALQQSLQHESLMPIHPVQVDRDKVARVSAISPTVEAGNVYLPENESWVQDLIDESASFPNGQYDDIVDALSQLLCYYLNFIKNPVVLPGVVDV